MVGKLIKKERAILFQTVLDDMFPDAHCELNHNNPFELLVAVVLSAQTTDVSVNKVTPSLFETYPTPVDLMHADLKSIETKIKTIGLYKNKAKMLHGLASSLVTEFQGEVPQTVQQLMTLPGVGQKTANVVASVAFDVPAIAVDTHVERVSKRLGFAKENDTVQIVEVKLQKLFKKETWSKLHHQMIFFGRYHCKAKQPQCLDCPMNAVCRYKDREKHLK